MENTLADALEERTWIGWHPFLLGYLTKKRLQLSSMDAHNRNKINLAAGRRRIHIFLETLCLLTRTLWLCRNNILHAKKEEVESKVYSVESAEI
jgi:hypothetical protein